MRENNLIKKEKILRLPSWIKFPISKASEFEKIQTLIKKSNIHTICEEARCPNRAECYASGTATFLLGGSICSRSCAFCQVNKGRPSSINIDECTQVAEAVKVLNLKYVVLTSVARDDLPDHGANLFISTIDEIRKIDSTIKIEVLTPDLWGGGKNFDETNKLQTERLKMILEKDPICFNHNLETVERLQKEVRRGANYKKSLSLLKKSKDIAPHIQTKSGIMLGLGETLDEIKNTIYDLKKIDCDQITIGQYLRPSFNHLAVKKYWDPSEFEYLYRFSKELGFKKVSSGPLVRSRYHAGKLSSIKESFFSSLFNMEIHSPFISVPAPPQTNLNKRSTGLEPTSLTILNPINLKYLTSFLLYPSLSKIAKSLTLLLDFFSIAQAIVVAHINSETKAGALLRILNVSS